MGRMPMRVALALFLLTVFESAGAQAIEIRTTTEGSCDWSPSYYMSDVPASAKVAGVVSVYVDDVSTLSNNSVLENILDNAKAATFHKCSTTNPQPTVVAVD